MTPGRPVSLLAEDALSPLFEAVAEATEEAIDNSLLRAQTVPGREGHVARALPIAQLQEILREAGRRNRNLVTEGDCRKRFLSATVFEEQTPAKPIPRSNDRIFDT